MKLIRLHEEFLDKARRPMSFDRLPIQAKENNLPIIPTNKWIENKKFITKTYSFKETLQKNEFIKDLLDYEESIGHHATLTIEKDTVQVVLQTKDIDQVTELDREYAKYADELFKDIAYNRKHA